MVKSPEYSVGENNEIYKIVCVNSLKPKHLVNKQKPLEILAQPKMKLVISAN